MKRIQQRLASGTIGQDVIDLRPTEHREQRENDHQIKDLRDDPLDAISHHQRDQSARQCHRQRDRHEERHEHDEGRNFERPNVQRGRQLQKVDEELRADRRDDAEIGDARQKSEDAGEQPKRFAVTNLEKLRQRHRARLAIAVDDETGNADDDKERIIDPIPPGQGQSRFGDGLEGRHESDRPRLQFPARDGQQVATRHAAAGEKIGHALDILVGIEGQAQNDEQRQGKENPIDNLHDDDPVDP